MEKLLCYAQHAMDHTLWYSMVLDLERNKNKKNHVKERRDTRVIQISTCTRKKPSIWQASAICLITWERLGPWRSWRSMRGMEPSNEDWTSSRFGRSFTGRTYLEGTQSILDARSDNRSFALAMATQEMSLYWGMACSGGRAHKFIEAVGCGW